MRSAINNGRGTGGGARNDVTTTLTARTDAQVRNYASEGGHAKVVRVADLLWEEDAVSASPWES